MAEWQTRQLQVLVSERAWGFKSPLAHERSLAVRGISAGSPASTLDGAAKFVARPVVDDQGRIAQQLTLRDVRREGEVDRFVGASGAPPEHRAG